MDSSQVTRAHYNPPGRSWQISVSEKLALYGSSALSGIEHLRLLVGIDSVADALVRHFGSLQALQRLSANDPTVKSGLNFKFEIYPMAQAVLRK